MANDPPTTNSNVLTGERAGRPKEFAVRFGEVVDQRGPQPRKQGWVWICECKDCLRESLELRTARAIECGRFFETQDAARDDFVEMVTLATHPTVGPHH